MSKNVLLGLSLVLLTAVGQSHAAEGMIPAKTLGAMGLSGATVVSDSEAATVRGMGYVPSHNSISIAAGGSFALVGEKGYHGGAAAGSVNVYFAKGKYMASGTNFSEAGITKTHSEVITIGGVTNSITTTKSLRVYAGGFSSATSF
ncbi:MAG: hypothetical protein SH868_17500 [Bythopirellula sp.]|nr:hypothetical protein [Bythopirellula sp.]